MAYLITTGGRSDFRINIEDLKNLLQSSWTLVEFEKITVPNDPLILHWRIEIDNDTLLGSMHDDNQTISIDGFPPSVSKFVIWYRNYVSNEYELFLSHDSSEEAIEIKVDTQVSELLEKLNDM